MSAFLECDTCRAKLGSPLLCPGCISNRASIQALEAERDRLREALEPFAIAADEADDWGYDDETAASVDNGSCRAARAALSDKGE